MECLGEERELPQKQNIHGEWHDKGAFFILTCDLPTKTIPPILAELGRDFDVLKKNFVAVTAGPADPPGKTTNTSLTICNLRVQIRIIVPVIHHLCRVHILIPQMAARWRRRCCRPHNDRQFRK